MADRREKSNDRISANTFIFELLLRIKELESQYCSTKGKEAILALFLSGPGWGLEKAALLCLSQLLPENDGVLELSIEISCSSSSSNFFVLVNFKSKCTDLVYQIN